MSVIKIEGKLTPVIAIPTTAGTGSEVTPYAVLRNPESNSKATIVSASIAPDVAIVDPSLTISLPPEVTAYTGADALAQPIESFLNFPNRTSFSVMTSLEAIRSIVGTLVKAVENGNDKKSRSLMSWASLLSGLSISMSGTGLGHAMAEALGGRTHIAHGKAVAVFLPAVLRLLEEEYGLSLMDLRVALGNPTALAYEQVKALWQDIGLPLTMVDLEIDEKFRPIIRNDTLTNAEWAMDANPVHLGERDVDRILTYL